MPLLSVFLDDDWFLAIDYIIISGGLVVDYSFPFFFFQLEKVSFIIHPLKNFFFVLNYVLSVDMVMRGSVILLGLFINEIYLSSLYYHQKIIVRFSLWNT